MTRAELRRLARIGAEARLDRLQQEIAAIHRVFPELQSARGVGTPNPYTAGVRAAFAGAVTRRRPTISPEGRHRIAEAQRKRWAEQRARQEAARSSAPARKPAAVRTKAPKKK